MEPNNLANPSPNLTPPPNPGLPDSPAPVMSPGSVQSPAQPAGPSGAAPASPVVSGDFSASPGASAPMPGNNISPDPASTPGQVVSGGFDPSPSAGPATMPPAPTFGGPSQSPSAAPSPTPNRRSLKPLIIALAAIVVLGGGSAAAYLGVILPNKPANVLKQALVNSLQQTHSSTSGTFEATASSTGKFTFSTQEDSVAKALDIQFNATSSGVSLPIEARLVNKDLYVKVGDLSAIAGLVNAYLPTYAGVAQSVSSIVSNKWIVVDSTLLNQSAGFKCFLDSSWTLSSSDIKLVEQQYNQHSFAAIQSSSSDTVAGKSAEKFVLNIDSGQLTNFGDNLSKLSLFKTLNQCAGGAAPTAAASSSDHTKIPLTVWVDKGSKRIVKIASSAKSLDGTLTINFKYDKVAITAPTGAEPAIQVLTDIENAAKGNPALLNLLNSSGAGL